MKLATASLLLLAACGSGPDPSKTGGAVSSVLVASVSSGAYVGSTALDAQGNVYVTASNVVGVLRFDASVVEPSPWIEPAAGAEVELAATGTQVFWAASQGAAASLFSVPASGFLSANPTKTAIDSGGDAVGLVADATAAYVAFAPPTLGPSPDSWQWPGPNSQDTPGVGRIFQVVPGPAGSVTELTAANGIKFFPAMMEHVLAQNSTTLFWADSTPSGAEQGRILATPKATWNAAAPTRVGGATLVPDVSVGFVGLAANESFVAWSIAPSPNPGATGCWVWAASTKGTAPKLLVDSTSAGDPFMCSGMAIDSTYAYFTVVSVFVPPSGPDNAILRGTAVARVPLAGGGAVQTVPLATDRWYGARRLLVDATYLYAVDPSYVLRFPKTVFGP